MSEVVLKGELHSSSGDLEEEKELVKQGFETLVLEGQDSVSDYGWTEGWFQISVVALFWIIGRVYVSKEILLDLADLQDTEVVFTRESDSALLENTSLSMKLFSAGVFYTLVVGSVPVGLVFPKLWGASILFMGFALPVLGIRFFNSRQLKTEKNREKIMADKIADAVEEGDRVLAVVGVSHVEGVKQYLPDRIDPEVKPPAYSRWSKPHLQETALPFFEVVLVMYSLYIAVSWLMIKVANIGAIFLL